MARRQPRKRQKPTARGPGAEGPRTQSQRLQKVLAAAGAGSRRRCEELILAGRVEVDGSVVTRLGTTVDPLRARIRLDGVPLTRPRRVYYALNKPRGVVCTSRDPGGRPRAIDLIPAQAGRVFAVGRLDLNSEGLILLTNDGELANQLTHPRYGVRKTYHVLVAGHPTREIVGRLRRGVHLAEGFARVPSVRIRRRRRQSTVLEMVLDEGRNREIRRVLARVGHKVLRLERVAIGPVRLGDLPPGAHRPLSRGEISALRGAVHVRRGR
jgi:23S rRNA pseudouridine2605 synthase